MSAYTVPALRVVTFGELEGSRWGVGWMTDGGGVMILDDGPGLAGDFAIEGSDSEQEWRLQGGDVELVAAPICEGVSTGDGGPLSGFDQLCRVQGRIVRGGNESQLEGLGTRSLRAGSLRLEQLDSARLISAWFEPAEGLSMLALRPRGAAGQEDDALSAAVLSPDQAASVADPRLSTTYGADGWPGRVGLELWLDPDLDPEEALAQEQYPRRAAGEASGGGVRAGAAGLELRAQPLRWHSESREGGGVYLLVTQA